MSSAPGPFAVTTDDVYARAERGSVAEDDRGRVEALLDDALPTARRVCPALRANPVDPEVAAEARGIICRAVIRAYRRAPGSALLTLPEATEQFERTTGGGMFTTDELAALAELTPRVAESGCYSLQLTASHPPLGR